MRADGVRRVAVRGVTLAIALAVASTGLRTIAPAAAAAPDVRSAPSASEPEAPVGWSGHPLDATEAFRFVSPFGTGAPSTSFDETLLPHLTVTTCRVANGGCPVVDRLTSSSSGRGQVRIADGARRYSAFWASPFPDEDATWHVDVGIGSVALGRTTITTANREAYVGPTKLGSANRPVLITFTVDAHPLVDATASRLRGIAALEAAQRLQSRYSLAAPDSAAVLLAADYGPPEVLAALVTSYGQTAAESAAHLLAAGVGTTPVADALSAHGLTATTAAWVLVALDVDDAAIGQALASPTGYGLDRAQAVAALVAGNWSAERIVTALVAGWSVDANAAALLMDAAGFDAATITGALVSVLGADGPAIASALHQAGAPAIDTAAALAGAFDATTTDLAGWMLTGGFAVTDVAAAIYDTLDASADDLAVALSAAGASADELVGAFVHIHDAALDDAALAGAAHRAGYPTVDWLSALRHHLGTTPARAAALTYTLQVGAPAAGAALASVFASLDDAGAGAVLLDAGYAVPDTMGALALAYATTGARATEIAWTNGASAAETADGLQRYYAGTHHLATALLLDAGFEPLPVAGALLLVFDVTPTEVADALDDQGVGTETIGHAIADAYGVGEDGVAAPLIAIGKSPLDVLSALVAIFAASPLEVLANALDNSGVELSKLVNALAAIASPEQVVAAVARLARPLADVALALKITLGLSAEALGTYLRLAGLGFEKLGAALAFAYGLTVDGLAILVDKLTVGLAERAEILGRVLKYTFDVTARELAVTLKQLVYSATAVAKALNAVVESTKEQVTQLLTELGYGLLEVAAGVKAAYNLASEVVVGMFKALGHGVREVAAVIKDALKESAQTATQLFRAAGYVTADAADMLHGVYDVTNAAAQEILLGAGYAASEITAAVRALWGAVTQAWCDVTQTC